MSISGVIAAAVTLYFTGGNVAAAAAAYSIASGIEALVLAPTNKVNGPKASDLTVQISSYGAVIPIIEGTFRVPGNIIWSTQKIPADHTTSTGGKGGSKTDTTTQTLSASFAILFCQGEDLDSGAGPAKGYRRIWIDKKLRLDVGQEADAATIIASTGLATSIRFYPGSETQDPDPLIESYDGVGNTDAKLGLVYMVFENFQLGEFGNRIPQFEVEIIKDGVLGITHKNISSLTVDDAGFTGFRGRAWMIDRVVYMWRLVTPLVYNQIALFKSTDGTEQFPLGLITLPTSAGIDITGEPFPVNTRDQFLIEYVEHHTDLSTGNIYQQLRIMDPLAIDEEDGGRVVTTVAICRTLLYATTYNEMFSNNRITAYDQDSLIVAFGHEDANARYFAERVTLFRGGDVYAEYQFRTAGVTGTTILCGLTLAAGRVFVMLYVGSLGRYELHILDQADGSLVDTFVGPTMGYTFGPQTIPSIRTDGSTVWAFSSDSLIGGGAKGVAWKWYADGSFVVLSPGIAGLDDAGTTAIALIGGAQGYVSDDHVIMLLQQQANAGVDPIYRVQLVHWNAIIASGIPLADIVERRCNQRNITANVTALAGMMESGLLIAKQMSSADVLTFLAATRFFDLIAPGDGTLYAKRRGGAPDGTVLIDDLAAHDFGAEVPDAFTDARTKEQDLPQYYSANFTDKDADYLLGNVPAQRQNTEAAQRITLDITALVLTAPEAAKIVDIAKTVSQVERMKSNFSGDYRMKKYLPGDVLLIVAVGITYRRRITKAQDHQGLIQYESVADDAFAYQSVATATGGGQAASTVTPSGSVHLELMDIPILRDEDDNTGFYGRISPTGTSWKGGQLYRNDSGGLLFEGSVSVATPVGVTLNAQADYVGPKVYDEGSYVDVRVYGGLALSSGTRAAPLAALVGREVEFYRTATALGGDKYRLTGWLRYQRGTEDAFGRHSAGERFVLLGIGGTLRVDNGVSDIGKLHAYTAVAPGRPLDTGDTRTFVNNARGLLPFTPICLGYGEDGSGGLLFTWRRRTRLQTVFGTEAPLGEASEEYRVDFSSTAGFTTVPVSFFTPVQRLALDSSQRLLLPSPFFWHPVMIGSGIGSSPTPPPPGTPGILPGPPADTLPTLALDIDPTGAADGAAIVDSSGTPATVFNSGCRIDTGRIVFSDLYTRLKVDGGTRFNLGTADFSLSFNVLVRSKLDTPDEQAILFNYGPEAGVMPGQIKIFFMADGRFLVYFIDYGSAYGAWVLQSPRSLNDGRARTFRVARSSGVFYLMMDGVVVDALTASVSQTPLTGIQLIIGGFKGSMGRITLKKP